MKLNQSGLTLLAVSIGIAVFSSLFFLILASINSVDTTLSQNRLLATKDRIISSVRSLAGLPASLRNSMIASDNTGVPINPGLLACAGGNPTNACVHKNQYPLVLFSPVLTFVGGLPQSVQPISSAINGAGPPLRFSTFGVPCTVAGPDCPLLVFTAFKPTCGPPFRNPLVPVDLTMFAPQATCTIADSIEVIYQVQLDPALLATNPELSIFSSPVNGSVSVPVELISGNIAQ